MLRVTFLFILFFVLTRSSFRTSSKGGNVPVELKEMVTLFSEPTNAPYLMSFLNVAQASDEATFVRSSLWQAECELGLRVISGIIRQYVDSHDDERKLIYWQDLFCSKGAVTCAMQLCLEPALMKHAWYLIIALLEGGNSNCQAALKKIFDDMPLTGNVVAQLIKDELNRSSSDLHGSTRRFLKIMTDQHLTYDGSPKDHYITLSIRDEEVFSWLWCLLRGLQLFAEGDDKSLQDYLRGHRASGTSSVNFIAELASELSLIHQNIS